MASTIAAITTGTGGVVTTADSSGNLSLLSGATTVVAVTSTGATVTGTLAASGAVSGTTGTFTGAVSGTTGTFTGVSTFPAGTALLPAITTTGDTNTGVWFPAADTVAASTGGTERMRIDSSGNVLVGTTSVLGSAKGICTYNPTSGVNSNVSVIGDTAGTAYHWTFNRGTSAGTETGSIRSSGSTTSYVTSSDYRLKENVAPMTDALAKVAALKPVTYKWKIDGSDGQGFIAHELQVVVPDCVSGEKDAVNEDGTIKPQGIDTSFLVATLTAAIQELKAIVDTQAKQIKALEGDK